MLPGSGNRAFTVAALGLAALLICPRLGVGAQAEAGGSPTIDFLDLDEGGASTAFSITGSTELRLPFTSTVPENTSREIEIYVTPFREAQQGNYITIEPAIAELPDLEPDDQRLALTLDRPVLTLVLRVPELPTSGDYHGQLIVLHAGQPLLTTGIDLRRASLAQPVELVIDQPQVNVTVSPWPWSPRRTAQFTVPVRNESDEWRARGVHLRLLEATHPEDTSFDPLQDLQLSWNGVAAQDVWHTPAPDAVDAARTIGPNDQVTLAGRTRMLPPGLYTVKVAVASVNPGAGEPPELALTLRIRHSVIWPILVLVLASLISLIATKGLKAQGKRVQLMKRVAEMRPPWLREEPSTLPVVAVRAILNQAEQRCRSLFAALFAPDIMGARVEKAAQLLGPLGRVREIRRRIEGWDQPQMIRNRAERRLRGILADLDPETASEKQSAEIDARLDELEKWLTSDRLYELYWADLTGDIDRLVAVFTPADFSTERQRRIAEALLAALNTKLAELTAKAQSKASAPEARSLRDYTEIEAYYAKLKVLWERHSDDDQEALDVLFPFLDKDVDVPIETFFNAADDLAWHRLIAQCNEVEPDDRQLRFISPRESTIQPLQAFQLIEFEIGPRDAPKLTNNYLFKHGLEYRWSLEIETVDWRGRHQSKRLLTRSTSDEPRIIQYVPHKGRLYVKVDLCREGRCDATLPMREPRGIAASGDFGWTSAFRFGEVTASLIAALFAIVSGLGTFYFDAPVFGTAQDYITLFIWGAGVDQTKNFIQNLEQVSPQS